MKKSTNKKKLKKCDFGTTAASYGASIGFDKNKKWADYTGVEKGLTIATGSVNAAGALSSVVGGAMNMTDKNPERFTKRDATANSFSNAGNMATQLGSAGAAFGPFGAAAGAVVGAGIGLITAGEENKRLLKEQAATDTITATSNAAEKVSNIGLPTTTRYNKNIGIPGMDKGIYKFYSNKNNTANAMVAPEEAIVSPDGKVDIMPGNYNKSNPDTIEASLEDGTSVLPKNPIFRLPDGKSTPADIAKKISKIQKKGDEIMSKINTSFIDRKTSELNKSNTDIALDGLNIYSEAIRNKIQSSNSNKFDNGTSSFDDKRINGNKKKLVYNNDMYGLNANYVPKEDYKSTSIPTVAELYKLNLNKYGLTGKDNPYQSVSVSNKNGDFSTYNNSYRKQPKSFNYSKSAITPKSAILEYASSLDQKNENTKTNSNDTSVAKNKDKSKVQGVGDSFKYNQSAVERAFALSSAIGSSLSQYANAIPEQITPYEYRASNYKYRSDLFNQLRDIQARENIARYNNRVIGNNSGIASSLNAASQKVSNSAASMAYDNNGKQLTNIDNLNRQELARIYNLNLQEKSKIRDINMRSKAAARNIKYAAIQDIAKTILPRNIDGSSYRYSGQ